MPLSNKTGVYINPDFDREFDPNAPTAVADSFRLVSGGTPVELAVVENDTDPDFVGTVPLRIASYSDPMVDGHVVGGLSAISSKLFTFTASDPLFDIGTHTVTFSYTVVDDFGAESGPATVTLTVTGGGPGSSDPGGGSQPGGTVGGGVLRGGNPPDALNGGDGDDYITGGNQNDTLTGGGGADTISGDNGEDIVRGDAGNDVLLGGNGKDTVTGGTGFDTLSGENGDDYLQADQGDDVLLGANGNDTMVGGAGADTMTGANGNDRFVFGANFGRDVITDFEVKGSSDLIQFSAGTFANYNDVRAHAQQVGADTVITTADGYSTLTLKQVLLSSLSSSDFIFG